MLRGDTQFEDILKTEYNNVFDDKCKSYSSDEIKHLYSGRFIELRKKAMITSYFKYGKLRENANNEAYDFFKSLKMRFGKAVASRNTEFLVDVANYCMMCAWYPEKGWVSRRVQKEPQGTLTALKQAIEEAEQTKNADYLAIAAVCCLLLFESPPKDWVYKATDSNESCGIAGYSINEIRNFEG